MYATTNTQAAKIQLSDIYQGLTLSIVGSVLAAYLPAKDASTTPAAQVLRVGAEKSQGLILDQPWWGISLIIFAMALTLLKPIAIGQGSPFPLAGYASSFFLIIGGTFLLPQIFIVFGYLLHPLSKRNALFMLVLARLKKLTNRHVFAAAALLIATTMSLAMITLISSFEQTMVTWIQTRFKADIFISSPISENQISANLIQSDTWGKILESKGIASVDLFQRFPIQCTDKKTLVCGANMKLLRDENLIPWILKPEPNSNWSVSEETSKNDILVTESFVQRFQKTKGDHILIQTPTGAKNLYISGVFADYGNEQGAILMDFTISRQWFADSATMNMTLYLDNPNEAEALINKMRLEHTGLTFRSQKELNERVMQIFHQTFSVTYALQWLGIIIALVGLSLSLISILRESSKELNTLHHLGVKRNEIGQYSALESLAITLTGSLAGFVLSIFLSYILIFVINKQSFGWTLQWQVPLSQYFSLTFLLAILSLILGYVVGIRMSQLKRTSKFL